MAKTNPREVLNDDDWNTVAEGSRTRVLFDEIGDEYIGQYQGAESILDPETGEEMRYLNFLTHGAQNSLEDGELVAISRSYALDQAFETIPEGLLCRIRLIKITPSKRGNDFKSYKVQTRSLP